MSRALILIAAVVLLREFLAPRRRKSPKEITPYMNRLDGTVSAQQISPVMDELRLHEAPVAGAAVSMKQTPASAA
jgi:hypothetical protein